MERLKFFGYIFFALALFFFVKVMKNQRIRKKGENKIIMTVIDNRMTHMSHGVISYTPIYEYEMDGEKKQFVSKTQVMKPLDLGHQITMYYDPKKDRILDPIMVTGEITLAMAFAGVAAIIIAIT